jgi:hypothetical protein
LVVRDAFDELEKNGVLLLETFVETLRNFLDIEAGSCSDGNIDKRKVFFLRQLENDALKFLN